MSKTKFLRLLTIGTFLSALYLGTNTLPASSQRSSADNSASLYTGAECITARDRFSGIRNDSTNVSISRQLYTSSMSMRASASSNKSTVLTCKADPKKFSTLKLQMGVSDDSRGELMTMNIYQGGNLQHTYKNIGPGKLINTVLDLEDRNITKPENITIELLCETGRCVVYFLEAQLLPNSNSNYIAPKSSKSSINTSQLGLQLTKK
ncbi:MAG: hypothetical protein ACR9NN_06095 [Nostochopsis sp.]